MKALTPGGPRAAGTLDGRYRTERAEIGRPGAGQEGRG